MKRIWRQLLLRKVIDLDIRILLKVYRSFKWNYIALQPLQLPWSWITWAENSLKLRSRNKAFHTVHGYMPHSFMHISIHYIYMCIYIYTQLILQTYLYYPSRLIFDHPNSLKGSFRLTLGVWDGALKFAPFAQHTLIKASRLWVKSLTIGMNPSKLPCIQEGLAWIDDSQYLYLIDDLPFLIKWLMAPSWGYKKEGPIFPQVIRD